ncbi:MAG TPA: glycosyl transferase [Burkholderiales bacterium]|nr:glycosyl transferase [Burkholderiales bacterium]
MIRGLALGALLAAWLVAGLVGHDPWKPDEAYTFGLVYHILQHNDWLVPTLAGEPFVEKPPLFYWTAALFANAFGAVLPLHDAARLATGFYVALTLAFTYLTAKDWCQSPIAAVLVLAGCLGYLQHAHQLITDNALMAGIAIGLYGLARGFGLLLATGAGIAFLSKGLLGPGMLALIAILLPLFREWRTPAYLRSLLVALLAFLPWALIWPALLYHESRALFDEWFWRNNLGRFTGEAGLGGVLDHAHYVKALAWFALPAWPLALWALWRDRFASPLVQLSTIAFVVMLAVLSAASSARTLYGLPLLVPLALLAAVGLESVPGWLARPLDLIAVVGGAALGLALWAGWLAFLAGWQPAPLEAQAPGFVPQFDPVTTVAAAVITALWLVSLRLSLPARWLASVTLVWGLAMTLWLPWLDYAKSYRGVIADMQRALPKGQCVSARNLTEPQRAMFHYFAGIEATRRDCPLLVIHTSSVQAPALGEGWQLRWRGTRPGDSKEFFWLYERTRALAAG